MWLVSKAGGCWQRPQHNAVLTVNVSVTVQGTCNAHTLLLPARQVDAWPTIRASGAQPQDEHQVRHTHNYCTALANLGQVMLGQHCQVCRQLGGFNGLLVLDWVVALAKENVVAHGGVQNPSRLCHVAEQQQEGVKIGQQCATLRFAPRGNIDRACGNLRDLALDTHSATVTVQLAKHGANQGTLATPHGSGTSDMRCWGHGCEGGQGNSSNKACPVLHG